MAKLPAHLADKLGAQDWSVVDEAVEGLEDSWRTTRNGDIVQFLPPPDHVWRQRVLVELIRVDQEYRWAAGEKRLLEAYLADWPELCGKAEVTRDLLKAECLNRATFDSIPTAEELGSRFPGISDQIDLAAIAAQARIERDPDPNASSGDTSKEAVDRTPAAGPTRPPLTVGQLFGRDGRYKIRELLGQGGMGTVYRAYDTGLQRDVALKIPRIDPAAEPAVLERFVRESRAAAKIQHPNVCPIFDAVEFEGTFYITMALIEGQSLADWQKGRNADPREAAELVWKLSRAMAAVHSAGIVHRDIKPSNVMIDRSGEPLLMDFGLARSTLADQVEHGLTMPLEAAQSGVDAATSRSEAASGPTSDDRLTHTGSLLGTLQYMSPEQTYGKDVDALSDVYSLGVLFYQVLTGRLPFEGSPNEILENIRHSEPSSPSSLRPGLDADLEAICLKALAKNPADRYQSAEEMEGSLQQYLKAAPRSNSPTWRHRWRAWISATAAAALLFFAVIIYIATDNGTIKIELSDPAANVDLKVDGQTVDIMGLKEPLKLRTGEHGLVVTSGEFETVTQKFVVRRGSQEIVHVSLVLTPPGGTPSAEVIPIERWVETAPITGMQLSRDNKTFYVSYGRYPSPGQVQEFDTLSGKLLQTITSPDENYDHKGLALSGDDRYLYVTNFFRRDISRIDLHEHNARTEVLITGVPHGVPHAVWATLIGITPDKKKLAVLVGCDGRSYDMDNDQVSIVEIAAGHFSLAGEVPLSDEPTGQIAMSSDSKFAYVVTYPRKSSAPTLCEIRLTPPFKVTRVVPFPDGQLVGLAVCSQLRRAFVSDVGRRKLWVVDLETFKAVCELKLDEYAPGPLAVTGRGNLLAVACPEGRKVFLYDPADGAMLGRVNGLREGLAGMEFSADGQRMFVWHGQPVGGVAVVNIGKLQGGLVFASNRAGEAYQIYRLPPGKKGPVRLTNNHAADRCPRWAPDGRKIAFVSTEPGTPRICITNCRGGPPTVLKETDPLMPGRGATLDWSPDGSEIAFIGGGARAIRIAEISTGKIRTLVEGELGDGCAHHLSLCWRKVDGLILACSQSPDSSHQQGVFLLDPFPIDSKTRRIKKVMSSGGNWAFLQASVSSPDGKKIAALRRPGVDLPPEKIYLADLDGLNMTCLVDTETKYQVALRWSPDGDRLAYSAAAAGRYHVFLVDVRDKKHVQVTSGDCDDIEPDVYGNSVAPESSAIEK